MEGKYTTVYDWNKKILGKAQQDMITRSIVKDRLDGLLLDLLKREVIDLWIIPANECNNDPVWESLTGNKLARRTSILLIGIRDEKLWTGCICRYEIEIEGHYEMLWNAESGEDQWQCLSKIVKEINPKVIGLNYSDHFSFGDGISHSLYKKTVAALGPELSERITSAGKLVVGYMEKRIERELAIYEGISSMTKGIIAEGFSERVLHPGVTKDVDILKWFRDYSVYFGIGYIKVQRKGYFSPSGGCFVDSEWKPKEGQNTEPLKNTVILPGDLVRCDCGMQYLGLFTDIQQNAYILRNGETDAPEGLKDAMKAANRLQDIVCEEFKEGVTGNEVLQRARKRAIEEGLKPSIYAHPIGLEDHGAGPTIGLWDNQEWIDGKGDYPIYNNTCYALELNNRYYVPEWDQEVILALEEQIAFVDDKTYFIGGRQTEFYLIK
ncbi:MAG: M24 family metallopeptidase [Eubacteriales bacterium]|nr:M24 family metallopeptidase [Eubacteriales bacterium]